MARGDQDALADPLTLGCHLDQRIARRPHLEVISSTVARLTPGGGDRVMIICPPQVGKSVLACWSVLWWLIHHPDHRVIIGSYGTTLASDRGRTIRRMVEAYGSRYDLHLMKGAKSVTNWSLTTGGGCRSAGVSAGITGNPADAFWIDDPIRSRADAESRIIREQVWDWWSGDANSRLAPGAPVVLLNTRWHCLVQSQLVMTATGERSIRDVATGDLVLTSDGYQPVLATAEKPHDGDVVSLRCYGTPEDLTVTPEHRIRTPQGWQEAGTLKPRDWVLLPGRPSAPEMTCDQLEGLLPPPPAPRANPVNPVAGNGSKAPLTRQEMIQHLDADMTYQQISEKYGRKTRTAAYAWARHLGVSRAGGNVLNPSAMNDPAFWRAVGFWLAEGTITYGKTAAKSHVCRWSFGEHEYETFAQETVNVLRRHGLTTAVVNVRRENRTENSLTSKPTQGTAVVTVSSRQLAELLSSFGKGARNKCLPDWAYTLPEKHTWAFIDGWADGDGCECKPNGGTRVTSTSFRLLVDMQALLAKLGVTSSIMRRGTGAAANEIRWNVSRRARGSWALRTDQYGQWARLKNTERNTYRGAVHDIQTPTGDFVAGGMLIHNCDDLSGRLLAEEGSVEEGGRWRVIYLPAFAVAPDAERGIPSDSLNRTPGEPLSHPRIDIGDTARLAAHWEDKKRSATPRDWAALWMGDPRPIEGALVTRALLRERRHYDPTATPIKHAVAVDPTGGGRDCAGIVGGWLGNDGRLYVSHDRSTPSGVSTEVWTDAVVMLAHELSADRIVYEQNYGRGMIKRLITVAWEDAQRRGKIPADTLMPQLVPVWARKGKLLRAEPVAQLIVVDKIRFTAPMLDLESQWTTWVPTDPLSPGALDAMVHLAYNLVKPRRKRGGGNKKGVNPGAVSRAAVAAATGSSMLATPVARQSASGLAGTRVR